VHVIRSVNEKQERKDLEREQMPEDGGDEIGLSLEKELLFAPVLKVPMPEDAHPSAHPYRAKALTRKEPNTKAMMAGFINIGKPVLSNSDSKER